MFSFIKKELEWLQHEVNIIIKNYPHTHKISKPIAEKIKSMIDSYCAHEWENICRQCTMDKIYCHKCEKDMGDLKERYPNE